MGYGDPPFRALFPPFHTHSMVADQAAPAPKVSMIDPPMDLIEEIEAKPEPAPEELSDQRAAYWAKRSCRGCNGTGKLTVAPVGRPTLRVTCPCVAKRMARGA